LDARVMKARASSSIIIINSNASGFKLDFVYISI
jgi:hypothetical protein